MTEAHKQKILGIHNELGQRRPIPLLFVDRHAVQTIPDSLTSMPSTAQPTPVQNEPHPQPVPPRARLEEMLGRDFTAFLLVALTDAQRAQGRRGSSSP